MQSSAKFNIGALKFVDLVSSSFLCLMYSLYIFKVLYSSTSICFLILLFIDFNSCSMYMFHLRCTCVKDLVVFVGN